MTNALRKPLSPDRFRTKTMPTAFLIGPRESGGTVLSGASLITRGEALGHDLWVDEAFLHQVVEHWPESGLKARFTHPSLSTDGLGSYLGRWQDPKVVDGHVTADLHISDLARSTPEGDLASYVTELAAQAPDAFGASIVFSRDPDSQSDFVAENTRRGRFVSPDEDNKDNLPHARLAKLHAGDLVDEPAANPDGLFHQRAKLATDAEALVDYALGLRSDVPTLTALDVDAGRVGAFLRNYLDRRNLELVPMAENDQTSPTDYSDPKPDDKPENQSEETSAEETEGAPASDTPEPSPPADDTVAAQVSQYRAAFGAKALDYLERGLDWQSATAEFLKHQSSRIEALEKTNAELLERLSKLSNAGADPVDFQSSEDKRNGAGLETRIRIAGQN